MHSPGDSGGKSWWGLGSFSHSAYHSLINTNRVALLSNPTMVQRKIQAVRNESLEEAGLNWASKEW